MKRLNYARARLSRHLPLALLASILLAGRAVPPNAVAHERDAATPSFRDGIVLVGFHENVRDSARSAIAAAIGAKHLGTIGAATHVLRVPFGAESAIVQALRLQDAVRYAEPDWIGHADAIPNDPGFSTQWAFQNTGRGIQGVAGADEKAVPAWDVTTGSKAIVVGVTDTGIEYTHSDLAANVWSNPGTSTDAPPAHTAIMC